MRLPIAPQHSGTQQATPTCAGGVSHGHPQPPVHQPLVPARHGIMLPGQRFRRDAHIPQPWVVRNVRMPVEIRGHQVPQVLVLGWYDHKVVACKVDSGSPMLTRFFPPELCSVSSLPCFWDQSGPSPQRNQLCGAHAPGFRDGEHEVMLRVLAVQRSFGAFPGTLHCILHSALLCL